MSHQKSVLDLHFLSPGILKHDAALADAVAEVEVLLNDTNVEAVIFDLLSKHGLLEFILSASPIISSRVSGHVLDRFPTTADAFPSSQAHVLLQRFWSYLYFVRRSFPDEISHNLDAYRKSVEFAPSVLQAISAILLSDVYMNSSVQTGTRQKGRRGRRTSITVDVEPFNKLGMNIPHTRQAAEQLAADVLQDQKRILKGYLAIICRPGLSHVFKAEYIPQDPLVSTDTIATRHPLKIQTSTNEGLNKVVPTAYPMVQPKKAALYFESAVGFGEWRILVSKRAIQDIREKQRTDPKLSQIIVKKIMELSNGHFSHDNQKRLNGPTVDVPIYEAKMTRDQRLVYHVDCISETNVNVERQVLKIFGIYTHAQLDHRRLWDFMSAQLGKKGKEYRRRCSFRNRPYHAGDSVITPAEFPTPVPTDNGAETSVLDLPHEDLEELHSLLVLEKFVPFSQALLNCIIADQDVTHPFFVTAQERQIIEHNSSCYVLGRSGTGKTTTMLFKMLAIEGAWAMQANGMSKPRQLFVTQSRALAGKVEEYFSQLMESLSTASHSPKELVNLAKTKQCEREEERLIDLDDEVTWRNDLPERFSLLEECHFPLFITFDRLCKMLEADLFLTKNDTAVFDDTDSPMFAQKPGLAGPHNHSQRQPGLFISYDVFLQSYWPRFSQSLTKGLDPSLVFSEFIGVIEGSEQTLNCAEHYLDQRSYENLSHRSQPTFSGQRDTIYALFKLYLKRKREQSHYDSADRTHSILNDMFNQELPGKIEYLYVDETQDNLIIDALLLRSLCRNPDGLFWAGDTAQTISAGSSFRFNDLKAFMFRVQEKIVSINNQRAPAQPRSFQLTANYRSHGGIVNCAHSVIELITRFWPYSIDILAEEKGIVNGLKPVFFYGGDSDAVEYEQFLSATPEKRIEFGADQCILVRDNDALVKLRERVGDIGLIMTLYESKGLEFNDVLLYNFFEDSTVDLSQWRVVLNSLHSSSSSSVLAPRFHESRHASVCSELKFLYVAITRARKNLWMVDCSEKSGPMRMIWSSKNQVHSFTPGTELPRLAVASSSQEWAATGERLFQHKRYQHAMHCFERASMHREVAVANAYSLRETARSVPIQSRRNGDTAMKTAFLVAARAFIDCATTATKEKGKRAYYRNAADCYLMNGDIPSAAQAFLDAKEYTRAAQQYRRAGLFDDTVRVIQNHRDDMTPDIVDSLVDVARLHYFKEHKLSHATELFETTKDALEFVEDYDFDVARAELLEATGKINDAGEVHLAKGRPLNAIQVFLKKPNDPYCMQRASDTVLGGLWTCLSFGVLPKTSKSDGTVKQLLAAAAHLNAEIIEPRELDEIAMFQALVSGNTERLQQLGLRFDKGGNRPAALLCLDHIFAGPLRLQELTVHSTASSLEMFLAYARLLHEVAFLPDPCDRRLVQKLFAFQASGDDRFSIPTGTFLYRKIREIQKYDAQFSDENDQSRTISRVDLSRVFKRSLGDRLRRVVLDENDAAIATKCFTPCLTALVGMCKSQDCSRYHVDRTILNMQWYHALVRIHFQQILILQTLHSVELGSEHLAQQRLWLERLYETLNPPFYLLGSLSNLELSRIPEAQKGLVAVNDWLRHLIYTINSLEPQDFLTTIMRAASLSFAFDRSEAASYIRRAPCITSIKPPPSLVRREHNIFVVNDLIYALHGVAPWSLSAGILFVRHVVQEKLFVDMSVLCNFIEYLCSSVVMSLRSQATSTPHDVMLPRSWLLALLKGQAVQSSRDTSLYWIFAQSLVALLQRVCVGGLYADHLLFEDGSLSIIFGPIKNAFVARICRTLCLLGYNIRNDELRHMILRGITSLNTGHRHLSYLYSRYITAKHWGQLVGAVRYSTNRSPMDEMVRLYFRSNTQNPRPIHGVRLVLFKNVEEIPYLLTVAPQSVLASNPGPKMDTVTSESGARDVSANTPVEIRTDLSSAQPSFDISEAVQKYFDVEPTFDDTEGELEGNDIEEDDIEELEVDHTVDAVTLARSMETARTQEIIVEPSLHEINAARIFQNAYRTRLRRRGSPTNRLSTAINRLYSSCLTVSKSMHWATWHYRCLFLGPLPHILLCLEQANAYAFELKTKLKKRLMEAKHEELEEVRMRMTEANRLIKDVQRLQKALEPKASVHQERDLVTLKVGYRR